MSVLDGLLRALGAVEKAVSTIAAIFMFAIMIIVFSDVVMRSHSTGRFRGPTT